MHGLEDFEFGRVTFPGTERQAVSIEPTGLLTPNL